MLNWFVKVYNLKNKFHASIFVVSVKSRERAPQLCSEGNGCLLINKIRVVSHRPHIYNTSIRGTVKHHWVIYPWIRELSLPTPCLTESDTSPVLSQAKTCRCIPISVNLARVLAGLNHCLCRKRMTTCYPVWCFSTGLEQFLTLAALGPQLKLLQQGWHTQQVHNCCKLI